MAASANDKLQKVGLATATTLDSNYTINDTTVTVASTSGWPTDTGVTFAIDTIDSAGLQVPGSYNEYVGVVSTATSITSVDWADGVGDKNYSAGASTRVYIPVTKTRENRIVDWGLEEHNQNGTHAAVTATSVTTSGAVLTNPKVITGVNDTNGNELLKVTATSSAVNELTLANAATGNAPSLTASGGDTNIGLTLVAKGSGDIGHTTTGNVKKNGNNIDWWEELGRTTLGSAGDTISVTPITAKKYLKVLVRIVSSGATQIVMRFNNDSSTNYAINTSTNSGAATTNGSQAGIYGIVSGSNEHQFAVFEIVNSPTANEKLTCGTITYAGTAGAGNAPGVVALFGKWANTSDQIVRVDVVNGGSGDFASGSEVIVLGHD